MWNFKPKTKARFNKVFVISCNCLKEGYSTQYLESPFIFGTDSRHGVRSRSNSSRRFISNSGGGNDKGTNLNQPSSSQQQKTSSTINPSNGKQRPHTADLHVGRSRMTSKSMKITSKTLSVEPNAKTKQSPSEPKNTLQRKCLFWL